MVQSTAIKGNPASNFSLPGLFVRGNQSPLGGVSSVTRYEPDTPRRERAAKGTGVSHARGGVPHGDEILSNTARSLGGSADISPQNEVWPRNQICDFFLVVLGYLSLTDQERGFIFGDGSRPAPEPALQQQSTTSNRRFSKRFRRFSQS